MSRAFTKEDAPSEQLLIPPRAPLPDGATNYVTPAGLTLLREERASLASARSDLMQQQDDADRKRALAINAGQLAALDERIGSARVVTYDPLPSTVRFGAEVTLADESGTERVIVIVGADEAALDERAVAFFSPIARAVMGSEEDDEVSFVSPRGEELLTVVSVRYP